jgi:GDP-L-fucose synthase
MSPFICSIRTSQSEAVKMSEINRDARFYVAGANGSAVVRKLSDVGFTNLMTPRRAELDLLDRPAVFAWFARNRPEYVIDSAAKVGGIHANNTYPAQFISQNLQIQVNLMDAAVEHGVTNFLFLGSSCIYPKFAEQPIREDSLLTGHLEPTNAAYAVAKIAGITQIQSIRTEYKLPYISAMPTNLYGPGDNFDLNNSHVLPAMIRKFHEAKIAGAAIVGLWGSGSPLREFLHVDDLAAACLHLLENYDDAAPINVGTGIDLSIRELAEMVREVVGFEGDIAWDASKPDGTPRKLLDTSRINALGWSPKIGLREGVTSTYNWYVNSL